MTDHPITPPDELVRQWATTNGTAYKDLFALCKSVATQAARWGADQELEACCEYIKLWFAVPKYRVEQLRAARRPKPKSQVEEAIPKPQPPPGRIIDASGRTIGYRPLPWDGPTNPPPRNP